MIISITRVPNAEATPLDPMIAEYSLVLVRAGPKGDQGDAGWSPTVVSVADGVRRVLKVTAWVGGEGTPPASNLYIGAGGLVPNIADATDFRGPDGQATSVTVNNVITTPAGTTASVVNVGTAYNALLNFSIPRGDPGNSASIAVGGVTTGAAGSAATVTNSGSATAAVLNFTIPKGDPGSLTSIGVTTPTGLAVSPPTLTANGSFALTWSAGYQGYTTAEATALANVGQYSARSANAALVAADKASFIDIVSGSFTQTFSAAAALGPKWSVILANHTAAGIPLAPNGAETIDGLTSYIMYPGEVRRFSCDGTTIKSVVLSPFFLDMTTSGNFIKPPGYSVFSGYLRPGSGGGGGGFFSTTASTASGGGGQSSGFGTFTRPASFFAASTAVVIGAAGAAGANGTSGAGTAGGTGGATSIGTLSSVNQTPQGGGAATSTAAGGLGGGAPSQTLLFSQLVDILVGGNPGVAGTTGAAPTGGIGGVLNNFFASASTSGGKGGDGRSTSNLSPAAPTAGVTGELIIWGVV